MMPIKSNIQDAYNQFTLLYWQDGKAYQCVVTKEQWRLVIPILQGLYDGAIKTHSAPIEGIQRDPSPQPETKKAPRLSKGAEG